MYRNRRAIIFAATLVALPMLAYFGGKFAPCSLWREIGFRPAWAVTCCCRTSGGGMCCAETSGTCFGTLIPGCWCQ